MNPGLALFLDLTANGGWNLTAIIFYTTVAALIGLAIYERN